MARYVPRVGRLSIARSLRVALLGLALVLAVIAGLGVAGLYSARQDYEDRLANAYGLQASAGRLRLDELVDATGRLAAGDLGARVREDGPGELRALGHSFNAMAADLQAATRRIESERARLDTTIRSLNDGLMVVGPDGSIEHANERATFLVPDPAVLPPARDALGREVTLERDGRTLELTA